MQGWTGRFLVYISPSSCRHFSTRSNARCPILARPFAQGWDSTAADLSGFPRGGWARHYAKNKKSSRNELRGERAGRDLSNRAEASGRLAGPPKAEPGAPSLRGLLRKGGIPQSPPSRDFLDRHDRKSGDVPSVHVPVRKRSVPWFRLCLYGRYLTAGDCRVVLRHRVGLQGSNSAAGTRTTRNLRIPRKRVQLWRARRSGLQGPSLFLLRVRGLRKHHCLRNPP